MAIIRRHSRRTKASDHDLVDTPARLLEFARKNNLELLPLDIEGVGNKLSIKISRTSLEDDVSGVLQENKSDNSWELLINKNHHPNRQRYTIAHEVGHYCLHRHLKTEFKDKIFFRGGDTTRQELQANSFASEVLMPEHEFRRLVREGTKSIEQLANIFKVSTLALRIRAKNLGMSGHGL